MRYPPKPTTGCTCDNASGFHWGKCPLNINPKPTTGEATDKSYAANKIRSMHEQLQQALTDARKTPEYAEEKASEPTTGEWTADKLRKLDHLSLDELADAINAALAAEREKHESSILSYITTHQADVNYNKQLRSQLGAAQAANKGVLEWAKQVASDGSLISYQALEQQFASPSTTALDAAIAAKVKEGK